MKTFTAIAAALLAASISTADAARKTEKDDFKVLFQGRNWYAYQVTSTQGDPVCGMTTSGHSNRGHDMVFNIKNISFDDGSDGLFFVITKNSWKFPEDGVEVPLSIGFGNDETEIVTATRRRLYDFLSWKVSYGGVHRPAEERRSARSLPRAARSRRYHVDQVQSRQRRALDLSHDGSRGAMTAFSKCLAKLSSSRETQPYAAPKETQPWDAKATSKMGRDI
jgi:hypothetical protein